MPILLPECLGRVTIKTCMGIPSISVVIPAFNAASTIGCAIDSVLNQTVSVSEIIIVDDGSSDDTAAVVKGYGLTVNSISIELIQQPNSRTAKARNRGIDRASGDWIAFLDADDYWEQDKIERQVAVLRSHPEVTLLAGRFYNQQSGNPPSDDGKTQPRRELPILRETRIFDRVLTPRRNDAFKLGTMVWTGTVLVRRDTIEGERFVSGLEPAEDRDLWIRLSASGNVFLDSTPLATAVLVPGSISRGSIATDCEKMLQVIDRNSHLMGMVSRSYWRSYVRYRWAAIDPTPTVAIPNLIRSIVGWPLPFLSMPTMKSLGRLRRFVVLMKRILVPSRKQEAIG